MFIFMSVLALSGVIIGLVILLMFAESKLVAQGEVNLNINKDSDLTKTTTPGTTLLNALADNKIFIPSACGGGGSCGQCLCQVNEGGGDLLPTETGFVNRKMAADNWRLACQVKVKGDIDITVPEECLSIKKFRCKVRSNDNVATFIKELVIEIQDGEELDFQAGGYIQIDIPEYKDLPFSGYDIGEDFKDDWTNFKMFDLKANNTEDMYRAYSMANHPAEGNIVMLNVRIATPPFDRVNGGFMDVNPGIASSYIFNLKEGDEVMVSGPYGEFYQQDTQNEMMYIGGGAGMAPLRSHVFDLFHTKKTNRKVSYWYGARSSKEVFYEEHFRKIEEEFPNFSFHLGLSEPQPEDNWTGLTGFIHNIVLENYLKDHPAPEDIEYYMCGPPIMSTSVIAMLHELGVEDNMIHKDDFGG